MLGQILSYNSISRTATIQLADGSIISPPVDVDFTPLIGKAAFYENGLLLTPAQASREVLTISRTYYVRTDGNSGNTGLDNSAGGAFQTIQQAINKVATLDLAGNTVTIQIGDGTYTGSTLISAPFVGGQVVIQGNSGTPANVLISVTGGHCFQNTASLAATVTIKDMEVRTTTSGNCFVQQGSGSIVVTNIRFGACAGYHLYCNTKTGQLSTTGPYAITGNATVHICALVGPIFNVNSTVTVSPGLTFTYFAWVDRQAFISVAGTTWSSNVATGQRFLVDRLSLLFTSGGSTTIFPGSVAGVQQGGGLYS